MPTLDPRLRLLLDQGLDAVPELADAMRRDTQPGELTFGVDESLSPLLVEVYVRASYDVDVAQLEAVGLRLWSVSRGAATIAGGEIDVNALTALQQVAGVQRVEASRPMHAELDLSCAEIGAQALHLATTPVRGVGVVIGIVDSGVDYTHPHFRNPDGSSRIEWLWDMAAPPDPTGEVDVGREYSKADLDAALASADPLAVIPTSGDISHGTHVAGIAAGDGVASGGAHTGVAPGASLIVVDYQPENVTLGRSVRASRAFSYVLHRAAGRPVAINFSQGMNGGGHSGETPLEEDIDNLCRRPNLVIVKSAGNEQQIQPHAGGQIAHGETVALEFRVGVNALSFDVFELWCDGGDILSIAVQPPVGEPTPFSSGLSLTPMALASGNQVRVTFDDDADETGDNLYTVRVEKGSAPKIVDGIWKLLLRGDQIANGRFDVWIERTNRNIQGVQTVFQPASFDRTRTITIPGTARRVITVGSYITRTGQGATTVLGNISGFSSRGPTRYGLLKPELVAPGEVIMSTAPVSSMPAGTSPLKALRLDRGTSMATPHVTGTAALILSVRPGLTCEQVKQILVQTARSASITVPLPDNTWGHGKLDASAAVEAARTARFPRIGSVQISGTRIRWRTDVPTTGSVTFGRHKRRLSLGRSEGALNSASLGTSHSVDLAGQPAGTYFCEVRAVTADGWWTEDDAEPTGHIVEV